MLVNVKDQKDNPQALQNDLKAMRQDINDMDNVDVVTAPQLSESKDYAMIAVIPEKGPNAESTNTLVHDLRTIMIKLKMNMTSRQFQAKALLI